MPWCRHWLHPGRVSSHLTFRARHVQHPVKVLLCFRMSDRRTGDDIESWDYVHRLLQACDGSIGRKCKRGTIAEGSSERQRLLLISGPLYCLGRGGLRGALSYLDAMRSRLDSEGDGNSRVHPITSHSFDRQVSHWHLECFYRSDRKCRYVDHAQWDNSTASDETT